ncbi:hypothetical protein IMY05_010G0097200 [Salix suchowensis]|nr:hypothetical protein IMY05_010G0097200 [Salix suchowensis]
MLKRRPGEVNASDPWPVIPEALALEMCCLKLEGSYLIHLQLWRGSAICGPVIFSSSKAFIYPSRSLTLTI